MKNVTACAAFVAAVITLAPAAFGQTPPSDPGATQPTNKVCTGARADAPKKIEGEVIKVEPDKGMLTVRTHDGKQQQFQGPKETVSEYKVGDKMEANLREQNC